ncbi:MAG: biotin/lipoyl-binding protein, partial [Leptolyngbyaceae cyanobacterium]
MTYRNFQDEPQLDTPPGDEYVNGAVMDATKRSPLAGMRGIAIGLLLGVGISLVGGRLLSRPSSEPTPASSEPADTTATSVTVQQVQSAAIQQSLRATGTVQAFDLLQISPQVGGLQIREVRVREGDQVATGQVLAVLDDSVLQTELTRLGPTTHKRRPRNNKSRPNRPKQTPKPP